jgi:hypothetical protein
MSCRSTLPHEPAVAAQHRVLVPEYQQLSILRHIPAERQDSEAEYLANQQVDDPDQHRPANHHRVKSAGTTQVATQSSIRAGGAAAACCTGCRADEPAATAC